MGTEFRGPRFAPSVFSVWLARLQAAFWHGVASGGEHGACSAKPSQFTLTWNHPAPNEANNINMTCDGISSSSNLAECNQSSYPLRQVYLARFPAL